MVLQLLYCNSILEDSQVVTLLLELCLVSIKLAGLHTVIMVGREKKKFLLLNLVKLTLKNLHKMIVLIMMRDLISLVLICKK